jgi:hypothetical protein
MSWIFSIVVGDQPRRPQRNDGYDLWHALLASAADVFVTHDERLAGLLARVPLASFRVVPSLDALLAEYRRRERRGLSSSSGAEIGPATASTSARVLKLSQPVPDRCPWGGQKTTLSSANPFTD